MTFPSFFLLYSQAAFAPFCEQESFSQTGNRGWVSPQTAHTPLQLEAALCCTPQEAKCLLTQAEYLH